jgi:hypothetical protein
MSLLENFVLEIFPFSDCVHLRGESAKCSAMLCMLASGRDTLYQQLKEHFPESLLNSLSPALPPQPPFLHQGLLDDLEKQNKTKAPF